MKTIPREEVARERVNRYLQELAEEAPTNMAAHATLLHTTSGGRPIVPARHHQEWVKMAHDVANNRWVVIICPPGYAKSTWWSIIYPTWRIGQTKGKIRLGLISNTAWLSYALARDIQKTISDPKFQMVYGIEPNYKAGWSQAQFWTTGSVDAKNPTVMASGMGGPIQGMRYDEIICDDLTTWEDARSPVTMEGQRQFVTALLLKRFEPGMGPPDGEGRMVVVMTRWSERDLIPLFEDLGFKIITMPALGYWDKHDLGDGKYAWGDEPLWPEAESKQQLLHEREEDPITFELVKQGNPHVLGGDVFEVEKLNHAPMGDKDEFRASFHDVVQFVDTAAGKDRLKGDYFALVTMGLRDNKGVEEVWVMDVERGRFPAPEQETAVIREAEEWNPSLVVIEDRGEGPYLFTRLAERTRLPIKLYYPEKDKEWRAIPLSGAINVSQKVWVPTGRTGAPLKWTRAFEMELSAFPRGANDDQVDAASCAYIHLGDSGPSLRVLSGGSGRRRHL